QRRDPEQRPSPEALLEAARREDSPLGRLKIFVGAAPGVGKTYEMLQSAHARLKAGADVVVGLVETHGRAETEALLRGLEVIPRQHIESLNDVVAQITHVRVRETVPDSIFDRADAIELIDLTPDDLIQRLKEGKVYVPKQAEHALAHFFAPANL